jgi:Zn-dependent protease
MKWSWKLGEFAGIAVNIHATFLLIILWIVSVTWTAESTWLDIVNAVIFILALFACVLLHEFGHALAARRFGIHTRDITLYPIGGVARLERMPEKPLQELWVAIAGPLVNVGIAALLFGWLYLSASVMPIDGVGIREGNMAERLMVINIFLVLFNLIPAFPMDGGRVLRALLAMKLPFERATRIASYVGQAMAMIFGVWGIFNNPFLIIIALFVWIGATQESSIVQIKYALRGIPVRDAMLTNFTTLSGYDNLGTAVEMILSGSQHDFPVVDEGKVVGVLTRNNLMHGLEKGGKTSFVQNFMTTDFQTVEPFELLDVAFTRLQACACHTMPVLHNGALIGLLTTDNIGEFMMIKQALKR